MSELMEDTVIELCKSLENDPDRWEITTCTLNDKKSGIEYWIGRGSITDEWTGNTSNEVFNNQQGAMIFSSFKILKETKGTESQLKVIESLNRKNEVGITPIPWWRFWEDKQ